MVCLGGVLVKKQALRYTPAGVPVIEVGLKHNSIQQDGKKPRAVEFEVEAVGFGELAQRVDEIPLGQEIEIKGFLAARNQRSALLVLHINEVMDKGRANAS